MTIQIVIDGKEAAGQDELLDLLADRIVKRMEVPTKENSELMRKNFWSQKDIAEYFSVSQQTVSKWKTAGKLPKTTDFNKWERQIIMKMAKLLR